MFLGPPGPDCKPHMNRIREVFPQPVSPIMTTGIPHLRMYQCKKRKKKDTKTLAKTVTVLTARKQDFRSFSVVMVVEKRRQHNRDGAVKEDRQDNRGSAVKRERRQ